jgi:hypothetical protein
LEASKSACSNWMVCAWKCSMSAWLAPFLVARKTTAALDRQSESCCCTCFDWVFSGECNTDTDTRHGRCPSMSVERRSSLRDVSVLGDVKSFPSESVSPSCPENKFKCDHGGRHPDFPRPRRGTFWLSLLGLL